MKTRFISGMSDTSAIYATKMPILTSPSMTLFVQPRGTMYFSMPRTSRAGSHINKSKASATPSTVPISDATAMIDLPNFLSSHFSNLLSASISTPSISVDSVSVLKLMTRVSAKPTMPLMTGTLQILYFSLRVCLCFCRTTISPSVLRTAMASPCLEFIITPSMTA